MADVVVGAIVFLAVCAVVWVAVRAYNSRLLPTKASHHETPWVLVEHSEEGADERLEMVAYCEHPGEERIRIGGVLCDDPDFESKIEEVRSRGEYKLAALNRPLRVLKRG